MFFYFIFFIFFIYLIQSTPFHYWRLFKLLYAILRYFTLIDVVWLLLNLFNWFNFVKRYIWSKFTGWVKKIFWTLCDFWTVCPFFGPNIQKMYGGKNVFMIRVRNFFLVYPRGNKFKNLWYQCWGVGWYKNLKN